MKDGDFLVVEHDGRNAKSYLPVEGKQNFRLLCSEREIELVVDRLKLAPAARIFESRKDRLNYFKTRAKIQKMDVISELIVELNSLEDRGKVEEQIYANLIESLALEYSIVIGTTMEKSKDIIINNIRGEL